jgi:adenylate kinase
MKILITGTPGTGKTSISKELSKIMKLPFIDVKELINENKKVIDYIDNNGLVINSGLKKILSKKLPKDCIFETHLIEYCPKPDITIILRAKPSALKKRLLLRNYSCQKIRDNLEVEIIDYFSQKIKWKSVIEYDSSKGSAKNNAKKIFEIIKLKKYNKGSIKYSSKEMKIALI